MSISITPSPALPASGRVVKIAFAASGGGSRVRLFITSAPSDSKFAKELSDSAASRVQVYSGDVATPFDFAPDVGGRYTFAAQEIQTPTFPGAFKGDTRGFIDIGGGTLGTEKVVGETAVTLDVGTRLLIPIGARPDIASLVVWVWGDTIHATTVALHGETTPILTNPSSPRAKTAAKSTSVIADLATLDGTPASDARGSDSTLATLIGQIWSKSMGHYSNATAHAHTDTDHTIDTAFLPNAIAPDSLNVFVNAALKSLTRHYENDKDGTGVGSAGTNSYHRPGGNTASDLGNALLFQGVSSPEDTLNAIADIVRSYEAHRVDTSVHNSADNTNNITATIPKLVTLARDFMTATAASTPAAAVGDSSGAALLKAWGAKAG